jgi:hypothetical protein
LGITFPLRVGTVRRQVGHRSELSKAELRHAKQKV